MYKDEIPSPEEVMEIQRRLEQMEQYLSGDRTASPDALEGESPFSPKRMRKDIKVLLSLINNLARRASATRCLTDDLRFLRVPKNALHEAWDLNCYLATFVPKQETEKVQEDLCKWTEDICYGDMWNTSCGGVFMLIEGTPEDNQIKFCPYCGKQLEKEN